jgi:ribosomal-protein-alanine N-acetyltransferase
VNPAWTPPTLETARLILRPVTPADVGAMFLYASNPAVTRFTLFETHRTIDDSRWFVHEYARDRYSVAEPDPFGIVLKGDPTGTVIGSVGAHWAGRANLVMEFGYTLAEPYWGRGLATEAAEAVVRHVFAEYPVERLQAQVIVGNAASERVLGKLGFAREGVLRSALVRRGRSWDVAMYSMLREEYWTGLTGWTGFQNKDRVGLLF